MKTVISFFLILLSNFSIACRLDNQNTYTSLSGPITMLLEELHLLNDPSLKVISKFHPVKEGTKVKMLAGGLFISSRVMKELAEQVVFIDASKELEDNFKKYKVKKLIVINTLGKNVFDVVRENIKDLSAYLLNCEKQLGELQKRIKNSETKVAEIKKNKGTFLFYLGEVSKSNLPNLLIVADGAVLTLIQNGLVSYPSELSYVTWADKVVKSLKNPVKHFGVVDGKSEKLQVTILEGSEKINLSMRGILTPGIRQMFFLNEFLEYLGSSRNP